MPYSILKELVENDRYLIGAIEAEGLMDRCIEIANGEWAAKVLPIEV